MLEVKTPQDLASHVGKPLGASEWFVIKQSHIDAFADLTGDRHWIHVDVERAKKEMPEGKTIAHGFFTLSLIPQLAQSIFKIQERGRGLNYGTNRVRFTAPVPVDSRIRLHQTLKAADKVDGGIRYTFECSMEVEHASRPAMVAETVVLIFEA